MLRPLLVGSLLLATCAPAALSKQPTPDSDSGHLRVYRQRRYVGSALAPSIFVDDKEVARVGNGRRVGVKLSSGTHSIRSDDKSSAITLDVKPGQQYFVRVDEATGFWKGHGKLTLLLPEQGAPEYKLQKPVEARAQTHGRHARRPGRNPRHTCRRRQDRKELRSIVSHESGCPIHAHRAWLG